MRLFTSLWENCCSSMAKAKGIPFIPTNSYIDYKKVSTCVKGIRFSPLPKQNSP